MGQCAHRRVRGRRKMTGRTCCVRSRKSDRCSCICHWSIKRPKCGLGIFCESVACNASRKMVYPHPWQYALSCLLLMCTCFDCCSSVVECCLCFFSGLVTQAPVRSVCVCVRVELCLADMTLPCQVRLRGPPKPMEGWGSGQIMEIAVRSAATAAICSLAVAFSQGLRKARRRDVNFLRLHVK